MKIKGRESDAWYTNINDTAGPRKPTDADFPWIALQNHTGYYMKKKGKLSQIQVDERLLALIKKYPSKELAIAACAHVVSARVIRNLLANDLKVEHGALGRQQYLQVIVTANHVNLAAVSEVEARCARYLLEHATAGGSSRTLGQQFHDVLPLLSARVAPDLLLQADISGLVHGACANFAEPLEVLRLENQWMDAHVVAGWLSTVVTGNDRLGIANAGTRLMLDECLPRWRAWAA